MTVQKHTDIVNPITDLDTSHCSPPQPLPPTAAASTAAPAASESTTPCPPFSVPATSTALDCLSPALVAEREESAEEHQALPLQSRQPMT